MKNAKQAQSGEDCYKYNEFLAFLLDETLKYW